MIGQNFKYVSFWVNDERITLLWEDFNEECIGIYDQLEAIGKGWA